MSTLHPAERTAAADSDTATAEIRPIVICEECGRKYSVSPSKIRGNAAGFTCRDCGHRIVVAKTRSLAQVEALPWPPPPAAAAELLDVQPLKPAAGATHGVGPLAAFGVITAAAIAAAAVFFLVRTPGLLAEFERQGRAAAVELARERIEHIAAAAAEQAGRLLAMAPGLDRRALAARPELHSLVMPPVGRSGQLLLYALPESDAAWRVWLHPDPHLAGADLSTLAAHVGPHFSEVWKILTGPANGAPASGHYWSQREDGEFQAQVMACWPVAGTDYVLAARAPVEELAAPLPELQRGAADLIREMAWTAACLMAGTALALTILTLLCTRRRSYSR